MAFNLLGMGEYEESFPVYINPLPNEIADNTLDVDDINAFLSEYPEVLLEHASELDPIANPELIIIPTIPVQSPRDYAVPHPMGPYSSMLWSDDVTMPMFMEMPQPEPRRLTARRGRPPRAAPTQPTIPVLGVEPSRDDNRQFAAVTFLSSDDVLKLLLHIDMDKKVPATDLAIQFRHEFPRLLKQMSSGQKKDDDKAFVAAQFLLMKAFLQKFKDTDQEAFKKQFPDVNPAVDGDVAEQLIAFKSTYHPRKLKQKLIKKSELRLRPNTDLNPERVLSILGEKAGVQLTPLDKMQAITALLAMVESVPQDALMRSLVETIVHNREAGVLKTPEQLLKGMLKWYESF